MTRPTINELVSGTGELATLPATVIQLLDILKDTTTSADKVRTVLERDPAMTANVLKLANSAYYGVRRSITNVRDALVMLGNRSVATLAFATGMAPILRRDLDSYHMDRYEFWRHGVIAAAAAAHVADVAGFPKLRCESFTGGLVHDVGMLVIDRWLVAEGRSLPETQDEEALRAAERDLLGFDHADAGAALAESWGFPPLLVDALRYHHAPAGADADRQVVGAVAAGDIVADAIVGRKDGAWSVGAVARLKDQGLSPADFDHLRVELTTDLEQTLACASRPVCPTA